MTVIPGTSDRQLTKFEVAIVTSKAMFYVNQIASAVKNRLLYESINI